MSKRVLVNFIQDRSGSMQSVWSETLSGFKKFVEELRESGPKDDIDYLFSLTTFDTLIETPLIAKPIAEVDVEVLTNHGPRGSTALYDAVGATIENTDSNRHGAEKIICIIVTDGQENSSREWSKDKLNQSIESKLNAGDWTFTYLGTQPETWDDASAIGVGVGAVASYTPTMARAAYTATAHAVRSLSMSAQCGTRSLMHDHVSASAARAAGMHVRPSTGSAARPKPTPATKVAASTKSSRRWR